MSESDSTLEFVRSAGFPEANWLASGMEGDVYRLNLDLIGKVWSRELDTPDSSSALFEELGNIGLPFAVPEPVRSIELGNGRLMAIEGFLPGSELDALYVPEEGRLSKDVIDALTVVLTSLRATDLVYDKYRVMNESSPYLGDYENWTDALVGLVDRRLEQFGTQLEAVVDNFDLVSRGLRDFVLSRRHIEPKLVHGDIFGGNILMSSDSSVSAVIDWGFLTIPADPVFDAAIAAGVFDLYGPHSRETETQLTDAFCESLGYTHRDMAAYKGIYALITSNAYDPEGRDGHFDWCAKMLQRADVQSAALATLEA